MTDERDDERMGEDEARAVRALEAAERADPPTGLAAAVMRAVRERGAPGRQLPGGWRVFRGGDSSFRSPGLRRHGSISGGSMSTSKKVLLGVAAVAVIAIGYFAIKGYPPVGSGAEGTVGAAKKYQSEQISAKDVVLEDTELQAFMQSEIFDKLVSDRASRRALASETFRQALASQAVQQALASQEVRQALASQAVQQALASQAVQQALASQEFQKALASQSVQQALASQEFQQALSSQAFQQALSSQAFQKALSSQEFQKALSSQAFQQALSSQAFQKALSSQEFQKALASQEFQKALSSQAFQASLASMEAME